MEPAIELNILLRTDFSIGTDWVPGPDTSSKEKGFMRVPVVQSYGSWKSPITAEMIASGSTGLSEVRLDGDEIYWLEMRPAEGGRSVIVRRRTDGIIEDCIPPGFNARTRVHEYGGGSYCVAAGTVFFSNFADHRLYRIQQGRTPEPISAEGAFRFADLTWDEKRERVLCVREDHTGNGEPVHTIVAVDPDRGGLGDVLATGRDFYAAPCPSPDGTSIAYVAWDHPFMPWDAAEVWRAPVLENGSLGEARRIAGGRTESALEPAWSPDGTLYFVSDRTDWWNIYCYREATTRAIAPRQEEFGSPPWVFGMRHYAFALPSRIVCTSTRDGMWTLAEINADVTGLRAISLPFTEYESIQCDRRQAVFLAGAPAMPRSVVRLDLGSRRTDILRSSVKLDIDSAYISTPESVEFPTEEGLCAYGLFYPPAHPEAIGPADEKPPLVVMIHGGPTSAASTALRLGIQYYTSRGIAVLDVNYRGSTGFGRTYRERLYGRWGVADVDDCCAGAEFLARQGRVDGKRMAIRGGSAGGYTTLACLAFRKVFAAGASHYGVSDCEVLAQDTHKFESRYLDSLIGPYPERRDLYIARSPIHHLDGLERPVIFFQGLDDKIVPPNQAEMMVEALKRRGVPVAYVPFEGEQHGFRKAENIRRALEAELYFFSRVFGFALSDEIPPLKIENL
jgi:dipeptidyl aminopeptidase/acylaminoacyl peptidase